jgi:hypothetical protein
LLSLYTNVNVIEHDCECAQPTFGLFRTRSRRSGMLPPSLPMTAQLKVVAI